MKWHWGTTIIALVALATASAVSAAPRDIVRDYADNGRLDGNYTAAEIQAALQNPTVQAYISPTERVGVVAGAEQVQQQPAAAPATTEVARTQQLPFTGQDVTVLVIGGLLLLVAGGALRLIARPKAAPPR